MVHQTLDLLQLEKLNKHQIGQFGNYWVRMYLTGLGLKVIDKGGGENSFFLKTSHSRLIEVYVRTARPKNKISYSFILKETWQNELLENRFLSLVFIESGRLPLIYLIPATSWLNPNSLLVDRNYAQEHQISKPEWGVSTNQKNMELLAEFELLEQLRKFS